MISADKKVGSSWMGSVQRESRRKGSVSMKTAQMINDRTRSIRLEDIQMENVQMEGVQMETVLEENSRGKVKKM